MLATCPICNFKEFETVLTFERAPIFQLVKGVEEVTSDSFARLEIVRLLAILADTEITGSDALD